MVAYYNEIDPFAAQWLRNLIDAGHIAPGVVDTRSIEDVTPNDLTGFTQVHLFAGIAGWSLALRRAGWPDNRPVWTGSCPCQPFSPAGRGGGFTDERHLWPSMHWLVGQCRPVVVFGEQSGSSHANNWIDLVQADVEALGYAFGAVSFPSASVGAPHQRDRAYWVADVSCEQWEGCGEFQPTGRGKPSASCVFSWLDNTERDRWSARRNGDYLWDDGKQPYADGENGSMADTDGNGREGRLSGRTDAEREAIDRPAGRGCTARGAGPVNGFWRDADWLHCRDGKWRPVRPGSFPLVDGVPGRVGRLRAYGNAINIEAATAFIRAYMAAADYV
ncbi:DNA cytosine methyltransferase [Klebsiella aerogenes]|uniref:DNA cytosine methyltransferase n=1 Tax=Klebsiella aerogenes TaxID=548 RepID=UPI003753A826